MAQNKDDSLDDCIVRAVQVRVAHCAKELVEEAKAKLAEKIPEIITSVVIDLMHTKQFDSIKDLIQIRIVK